MPNFEGVFGSQICWNLDYKKLIKINPNIKDGPLPVQLGKNWKKLTPLIGVKKPQLTIGQL